MSCRDSVHIPKAVHSFTYCSFKGSTTACQNHSLKRRWLVYIPCDAIAIREKGVREREKDETVNSYQERKAKEGDERRGP